MVLYCGFVWLCIFLLLMICILCLFGVVCVFIDVKLLMFFYLKVLGIIVIWPVAVVGSVMVWSMVMCVSFGYWVFRVEGFVAIVCNFLVRLGCCLVSRLRRIEVCERNMLVF